MRSDYSLNSDFYLNNQIQREYGNEQADAGRENRTRLARPNSQARTGKGKKSDHEQDWQPYPVDTNTLAICDDRTYIRCRFFRAFFVPTDHFLFLFVWRLRRTYVLSFRIVFFSTGWIFDIISLLCENPINQSVNQSINMHPSRQPHVSLPFICFIFMFPVFLEMLLFPSIFCINYRFLIVWRVRDTFSPCG